LLSYGFNLLFKYTGYLWTYDVLECTTSVLKKIADRSVSLNYPTE